MAWKKVVERKQESALIISYLLEGVRRSRYREAIGVDRGIEQYRFIRGSSYPNAEEFEATGNAIWAHVLAHGLPWARDKLALLEKRGEALVQYGQRLANQSSVFASQTNAELSETFGRFAELNLSFGPALFFPLVIEKHAEEDIERALKTRFPHNPETVKKHFLTLTFPLRRTRSDDELVDFYALAAWIEQNRLASLFTTAQDVARLVSTVTANASLRERLEKHLVSYAWINTRWYVGTPWTVQDVCLRLSQALAQRNAAAKHHELYESRAQNEQATRALMTELAFDDKLQDRVWLAKDIVFFRSHRTETFNLAGFLARPLLVQIAKRLNVTYEDVTNMTYREILAYLTGTPVPMGEVAARRNGFGVVLENGVARGISGAELDALAKEMETPVQRVAQLTGVTANPGRAKGPCKIVMSPVDFHKFKAGDVLVTAMTTPDFVPLMQKAAAIVTDEGGILCHAAIISRELNVPCVIGTRSATKNFNDGEGLDVDATNGHVTKSSPA